METRPPSVVCPVDFSDPSRSALGYAAAIANHFGARLLVLTVDDPLLAQAATTAGSIPSMAVETECELRRFCESAVPDFGKKPKTVEFRVTVGKPATEILREATAANADLIVPVSTIDSRGICSGIERRRRGRTRALDW